jgi:hypothetical protein
MLHAQSLTLLDLIIKLQVTINVKWKPLVNPLPVLFKALVCDAIPPFVGI